MQKERYIWLILLLLIVVSPVTGCQGEPTVEATEQSVEPTSMQEELTEKQPTATQIAVVSSPLNSPVETPQSAPTPTLPNLASGKAAIRGALIANSTFKPIGGTLFYLTPGVGEQRGQMPLLLAGPQEGDIRGYTDNRGWFAMGDIPPGTYYMIIWAPLSWVVLSEAEKDSQPIQLNLEPGQLLDLGEVLARWP